MKINEIENNNDKEELFITTLKGDFYKTPDLMIKLIKSTKKSNLAVIRNTILNYLKSVGFVKLTGASYYKNHENVVIYFGPHTIDEKALLFMMFSENSMNSHQYSLTIKSKHNIKVTQ